MLESVSTALFHAHRIVPARDLEGELFSCFPFSRIDIDMFPDDTVSNVRREKCFCAERRN